MSCTSNLSLQFLDVSQDTTGTPLGGLIPSRSQTGLTRLSLLGWRMMEKSQPEPSCWAEQGNRKTTTTQEPFPAPSAIPWLINAWSDLTCSGSGWGLVLPAVQPLHPSLG